VSVAVARRSTLADVIALGKPRITFMVLVTTMTGLWLAPGAVAPSLILSTLAGVALIVAGANAQMMAQNDLGSLIGVLKAMGALAIPPGGKPARSTRVLIAAGSEDPLLPQSRALAASWPEARLLEVSGANHDTIRAHGEVVAAVRSLIRGTRP